MPFSFIVNSRYNRYLIWIMIIIPLMIFKTTNLELSKGDIIVRQQFQSKHKWLNNDLYSLYRFRSLYKKVPLSLALAVVKVESGGKIVVSKKNKNGTRDYGRFQINSCHLSENPIYLMSDKINSKYGFWYLSRCLKKSNGNISEAVRMYNQGMNGKKKNYKNWKYVKRIMGIYETNTLLLSTRGL